MHRYESRILVIKIFILVAGIGLIVGLWHHQTKGIPPASSKQSATRNSVVAARNELNRIYPFHEPPDQRRAYFGAAAGCHLIVVQLESFQNFLMNAALQGQPLTPAMNQLSKESLYFPHVFQQIGIGNTSDAEFLSNTSMYPPGMFPSSSQYGDRKIMSLARILRNRGYRANTFHVNDVTFWNRNQLYPALGFDAYYDKAFFRRESFNRFGASDEELFRVGIDKMVASDACHEKFYSQFITVSSHAPFTIPKEHRRLSLPQDIKDRRLGDYLTAVNYADHALGTFIRRLKETGLWDKSVLVVYGDHFGLHKKYHQPEAISEWLGVPYHKQISTYNVPLIIHLPGQQQGKIIRQSGGQIDILPTLANIMGMKPDKEGLATFGHDLLNVEHNIVGMRYYLPTGSFINDDVLFIPGKKGFLDGEAVFIRTLKPVRDIQRYKLEYDYIIQWMNLSDRYAKQQPVRKDAQGGGKAEP
ncbi:sulfatase-like hydrolase/transferase [Paenibacillus sp. HJL G12]|uniref:Sulfatase-like hydrolase/transferase n=1 Tax=Paenibacillus dendrobii TaxID=2691084 RepID=A0A7X3IMP7_9BACL|nr:LTA synthase family protein [Paenibacillus dendrobii]MWV45480.1 sulfatase-like hydrolase/transferase [Paenibacillus dendrobii]